MAKVLLVDDEMTIVQTVSELLRAEGHQVIPFTHGSAALDKLASLAPELIVVNLCSERARCAGLAVLQKARALNPPGLVLAITATGAMDSALDAMRKGAYDYLGKPFSPEELRLRVQRALAHHAAVSENLALRRQVQPEMPFQQVITCSPKMQSVLQLLERLAGSDTPFLIQGQRGTGKQLLARIIHFKSRRRFAPFFTLSCSALPEALLEVELFGQRKAPFAPATEDRMGLFKEAEGGTILLGDIASLSPSLQSHLIEALDLRQIRPAGGGTSVSIDVRVLAATEEPIERKVASGAFRADLFERLAQPTLCIPPLHDRPEDIPLLIAHFVEGRIHPRTGKAIAVSREAVEVCCAYAWPGNVRELENAIEHACMLCHENTIAPVDLPRTVQQFKTAPQANAPALKPNGFEEDQHGLGVLTPSLGIATNESKHATDLVPLKKFLRDQEIGYLQRTLAQVGGSKEKAAELLGISLATMYRKLSEPDESPGALSTIAVQ
jgi:DNA-binding NtrC family response regulator